MSHQLILLQLVLLTCLQYSYGDPDVEVKLARAQELMGQLVSKSAGLNVIVSDVEQDVSNLKCGFKTLKNDVTVLESARSELETSPLDQHDQEAASQLSDLLGAIEEKKERVNTVKDFTHPCGHGSWELVEYLDLRDAGTTCPTVFASEAFSERPYTCSILSTESGAVCDDTYTIQVGSREYSRVCGRIRGYQYGLPSAFLSVISLSQSLNEAYLSGVSLTHGGTLGDPANPATHIWSFVMGFHQDQTSSFGAVRCPCDGGDPSPDFIGEDYFCESAIEDQSETSIIFHPRNTLWDGKDCGENSDCCTRLSHPYFVKQLEQPTTDNIDLRMCKGSNSQDENMALELVEIYIE